MTDAEYSRLLEANNAMLMRLLGAAIRALPEPRRGRQPGELVNPRFWGDRAWSNLTRDVVDRYPDYPMPGSDGQA